MKELAQAMMIAALVCPLAYCVVNDDNNHHEMKMWCLQHGGKLNMWNDACEKAMP